MATQNDAVVDSQLWHACAGPLVRLPPANSVVYYFPQGHADNANCPPEFSAALAGLAPPIVRCRLAALRLSADPSTDEVFARMSLVPVAGAGAGDSPPAAAAEGEWCSKVLTQSDANNGGGFSVPKACADKIFPALDYDADPPVQVILPRDVHGKEWTFRHIYRGTPRRHLLTSGWSVFVNEKSLVAGDCIVFAKTAGGVGVGVRRGRRRRRGGSAAEDDVAAAARLAAAGEAFDVSYYPAAGEEFVVRAAAVEAAAALTRKTLFTGAKVRMDFEDGVDPTMKKSCSGTVASIQPSHPIHFPSSPWRMLTVAWDGTPQSDQQSAVSHVSPWSISIESNIEIPYLPGFIASAGQLPVATPHQYALAVQPSQSPPHNNNNNNIKSSHNEHNSKAAEEERGASSSVTSDTAENKEVRLFGVNIIASTSPKKALSGSPAEETAPAPAVPEIKPQPDGGDDAGPADKLLSYPLKKRARKPLHSGNSSFNDMNGRKRKSQDRHLREPSMNDE